jgi:hypothetical protein
MHREANFDDYLQFGCHPLEVIRHGTSYPSVSGVNRVGRQLWCQDTGTWAQVPEMARVSIGLSNLNLQL